MNKPFVVVQCNEKSTKPGNFITKLQRETVVKDEFFGEKKKTETLYIAGTKAVELKTEIPAKHIEEHYRIQEYPMLNPDTNEEFMGKWLHLK